MTTITRLALDAISAIGRSRPFAFRPTTFDTPREYLSTYTEFFSEISQDEGFAVIGDLGIKRGISRLFFGRSPSAVSRLVISALIRITIQSGASRALAHIGQKVFERLPAVADRNTRATISWVVSVKRRQTSPHHVFPRLIGPAGSSVGSMPMPLAANLGSTRERTVLRWPVQYLPFGNQKRGAAVYTIALYTRHFRRHFISPHYEHMQWIFRIHFDFVKPNQEVS